DEAAEGWGWSRRTLLRRFDGARGRLGRRLGRRGVETLGLGGAVLPPAGLATPVPDPLLTAAVGVGTGGAVPAGVRALAGGAALKSLHVVAGLSLLLAGAGLGLAAFPARPATPPPAAAGPDDRIPAPQEQAQAVAGAGRPRRGGALHRLGSRRFRVEGGWSCFALPTPDGKHILVQPQPRLSAYAAQGLMLLDADTGLRVRAFDGGRRGPKLTAHGVVGPAAFSPDGTPPFAVANLDTHAESWWGLDQNPCPPVLRVWDVGTGKRKSEWPLPHDRFASLLGVNLTPDGKRVFVYGRVSAELGVHVLDADTGKHLATWVNAG